MSSQILSWWSLCIFWSYDLDSFGGGAEPWHFPKEQWDLRSLELGQWHMDVGGTELSMSRIIRTAVNWICEGC